jgi:hypothetical protein
MTAGIVRRLSRVNLLPTGSHSFAITGTIVGSLSADWGMVVNAMSGNRNAACGQNNNWERKLKRAKPTIRRQQAGSCLLRAREHVAAALVGKTPRKAPKPSSHWPMRPMAKPVHVEQVLTTSISDDPPKSHRSLLFDREAFSLLRVPAPSAFNPSQFNQAAIRI